MKVTDFMPQRDVAPDVVRIVEGVSGTVEMNATLRLRFDYGSIVPWMRRTDGQRVAVAGPDSVWLRSVSRARPVGGELAPNEKPVVKTWGQEFSTCSSFTVGAGEKVAFVLTWHPRTCRAPIWSTRSRPWSTARRTGRNGRRAARTKGRTARRSCAPC